MKNEIIIFEDQNVKLDMYEYDTVVSDEAINLDGITSLEGEIEGKYDFERFVYTNNDTTSHTIRIENIGNDKVVVFKNEKWYSKEVLETRFRSLYNAFQYGVPPHAGMAPGIDRIIMLLQDEPNLREVQAFPMSVSGQDMMMGCPSELTEQQLREVHIKIR